MVGTFKKSTHPILIILVLSSDLLKQYCYMLKRTGTASMVEENSFLQLWTYELVILLHVYWNLTFKTCNV